ncbi:MAG: hypothetical protein OXC14_20055 [Rhodospirillaceae bacterium]|nr:hypothetical protein [Rhodospirillaceae bacterium]
MVTETESRRAAPRARQHSVPRLSPVERAAIRAANEAIQTANSNLARMALEAGGALTLAEQVQSAHEKELRTVLSAAGAPYSSLLLHHQREKALRTVLVGSGPSFRPKRKKPVARRSKKVAPLPDWGGGNDYY